MEFVELLEKISGYISAEYSGILAFLEVLIPILFITAAVATCFFGHKLHKIWTAFLFFSIGFFAFTFIGVFFPKLSVWIFIVLGLAVGTAAAVYSHKLFKIQSFLVNMVMSYIFVSDFLLMFLPKGISLLIALACGIAVGILATRYKYIFLLITTSIMGATITISTLFQALSYDNNVLKIILTVLLSAAGLLVQFYFERKELKETGHKLLERADKAHKTSQKAKNIIKDKIRI